MSCTCTKYVPVRMVKYNSKEGVEVYNGYVHFMNSLPLFDLIQLVKKECNSNRKQIRSLLGNYLCCVRYAVSLVNAFPLLDVCFSFHDQFISYFYIYRLPHLWTVLVSTAPNHTICGPLSGTESTMIIARTDSMWTVRRHSKSLSVPETTRRWCQTQQISQLLHRSSVSLSVW